MRSSILSPRSLLRLPEWSGWEGNYSPQGQLTGSEGKLCFLLGPREPRFSERLPGSPCWSSSGGGDAEGEEGAGGDKGGERTRGSEERMRQREGRGRASGERKREGGGGEDQRQKVTDGGKA